MENVHDQCSVLIVTLVYINNKIYSQVVNI